MMFLFQHSRNSLTAQLPPPGPPSRPQSKSPTNNQLALPRRQQRRMSVDESQQRRLQARNGSICVTSPHKYSLTMMNGEEGRFDAKTRINKAAKEFAETGDFGLTLQEHLKLTRYVF